MTTNQLKRSNTQVMIAGVCGGISEHFGWDISLVRVVFVFGAILGFSTVFLYLVLLLLMPKAF